MRSDATQCPDDGAAPETVETLPVGARLGKYRIDKVLGEGGMGFVYAATQEDLKRRTAIKMLRPELSKLDQIVTRFLNEAKAVNLIDHQNVVNIYDYGDGLDGSVYFVMEFLEGETLDDLMYKRRPMPVPLLLHVFGQIAKALAAAHAKQIVHRDLKPANVFVVAREDNPCFIKLLDFGIAQLRGEGAVQGLTVAGTVMGTPQFMSPEQISGGTVDARSDVWALGVMMYQAATGHMPFGGEEFAEIANKILNYPPPPAGSLAQLPAELSRLIASCLERDLAARCPSIAELIAGLERVKRECRLDDDKLLATVKAEAGAAVVGLPGASPRAPRPRIEGSLQEFQDVPGAYARRALAAGAGPAPRRSRLGLYMVVGAIVGGIGSAGLVVFRRGEAATTTTPAPAPGPAPELGVSCLARGAGDPAEAGALRRPTPPPDLQDLAAWRAYAEEHLCYAIVAGTLQEKGLAVDALERARVPAGARLLYLALKQSPEVRVKAARALGELALPASVPKVQEALAASGDKLKLELATVLFRLGNKEARPILIRALGEPTQRLAAARALALAGDDAGRAVLMDVLDSMGIEHDQGRRAAGGLLGLDDARARKQLEGELSQRDAARSAGAAELLARAGDDKARAQLASNATDPDFPRAGDAALALARLGDRRALDWVPRGLKSHDPDERKLALAICGPLAAGAAAHAPAIAMKAAGDGDLSVRMTAEAVLLGLETIR